MECARRLVGVDRELGAEVPGVTEYCMGEYVEGVGVEHKKGYSRTTE